MVNIIVISTSYTATCVSLHLLLCRLIWISIKSSCSIWSNDNKSAPCGCCNDERMIGNCFFFKKDDNTKMKKNAIFFWFFPGKERGQIVPGCPRIGVLTNSCVIICANFVLKSTQKDIISWMNRIDIMSSIP